MPILSFPLGLDQFYDLLPIGSMRWDLPEALDVSETAGGEILTADLGTTLWSGEIDLGFMRHAEAADVVPLINLLRRGGTSFLVADSTRPWPRLDPRGLILGNAQPTIRFISQDRRELGLDGTPPGYQLSRGDLISFTYGSNPTRYALHELVESRTGFQSGIMPTFEVNPPIRAGASIGTPVQLINARCKARLVPGSVDLGRSRHTITSEAKFAWTQTLR
jgi:hypothetical protein